MARIAVFLFQLLSLAALARALDITGQLVWNDVCRNSTSLGRATASLDEGVLSGSITQEGKFTIPDVPDGVYILSVYSHDYAFDQLRIDVTSNSTPQVEVRPYVAGTPLSPPSTVILPFPVMVAPKEKYVYFVPHESFNLGGMLGNPMMLMMIGLGAFMFGMPYIMKNLDPEMLEDLKKEQAKMGSLQSALQTGDLKSGLSALMAGGEEPAASPASSKGGSKGKSGNKKGRR